MIIEGQQTQPQEVQAPVMNSAEQSAMFALSGINDDASPALAELGNHLAQQTQPVAEAAPASTGEPLLVNNEQNINPNTTEQPAATPEAIAAEAQLASTEELPPATPAAAPAVQESAVDSPLFSMPEAPTEESQTLSQIQGIEGVNSYITEKHPELKDLNGLMERFDSMTTENSDLSQVKIQNENLVNGLKSLHPDLVEAIRLYESGEDFRGYISSQPNVDYDSKVEDIDKQVLINAYSPGEISDADFEAANKESDDYDPNVARLIDTVYKSSVDKFNTAKASRVNRTDTYLAEKQIKDDAFKVSVEKSLGSVSEFFPDATPTYIKSVEEKLLNDGINSLFYDENGQFKPDAAARFVRASDDGASLVSQLQKIAYSQAKTDANLDTLTRGQRTAPEQGGREMRQDESQKEVDNFMANVVGNMNAGPSY